MGIWVIVSMRDGSSLVPPGLALEDGLATVLQAVHVDHCAQTSARVADRTDVDAPAAAADRIVGGTKQKR